MQFFNADRIGSLLQIKKCRLLKESCALQYCASSLAHFLFASALVLQVSTVWRKGQSFFPPAERVYIISKIQKYLTRCIRQIPFNDFLMFDMT